MKRIILSLLTLSLTASIAVSATGAYFSDVKTSNSNRFTAGTLGLSIDGTDSNIVKFTISDLKPGDVKTGIWALKNSGSIDGYIDIHNIVQTHAGGTSTASELAVDPGNAGNLGALLNAVFFVDGNNNSVYDAGADTLIYSGVLESMNANYDQNEVLAAGSTKNLGLTVNWPSGANDNMGQGDIAQIDMTFELGQTTAQ